MMKRYLLIIATLLWTMVALAGVKVLERSAKQVPDWVSGAAEGYLLAAVEAPDLAKARLLAEEDIARQVAMAVARNVVAGSRNDSREIVTSDGVDSRDDFASHLIINAANMPFLKGVSLSKADGIYWVKVQDKATKQSYYQYFVRYPLFRQELAAMVLEFEEFDAAREAELNRLEDEASQVGSMDDINRAVTKLKALTEYFADAPRREKARELTARYQAMPRQVMITAEFAAPRQLVVTLMLNGRPFNAGTRCKAESNCATDVQVSPQADGTYLVTFNDEYCLEDEENYIEVKTTVGGKRLTNRYVIPTITE